MPQPPDVAGAKGRAALRQFSAAEWAAAVGAARERAGTFGLRLAGAQIFLCGPVGYDPLARGPEVFAALRDAQDNSHPNSQQGFRYLVHGNYMDSMAFRAPSPRATGARKHLAGQIFACGGFGGDGVIAHLPQESPEAVAEVAADVARMAAARYNSVRQTKVSAGPRGARLYLETSAAKPAKPDGWVYGRAGQLRALVAALDDAGLLRGERTRSGVVVGAGVCVDTAHVWAQGGDAVVTYEDGEELLRPALEAAAEKLPLEIHLNDCWLDRGVGRDEHAPIGAGKIWDGVDFWESSAAAMVDAARECDGLAVLERKGAAGNDEDYAVLAAACAANE